jgi:ribonuclease H / adenosylcobalamin/alpha-ribazole phosphatase
MRLYVIRHGDAAHTPYTYGVTKPLTELGQAQARAAGEALRGHGITHIYSSTVRRTRETAEIIAAALGLPVEHSDDWVEHLIPAIDGMTLEEIREKLPHLAPDRTDEPWWERDFGPDGESFPMLYERALRAWTALNERHGATNDTPLLVTHGGFADFFLQAALGIRPSRHLFQFRNTGIAVLNTDGGAARVEFLPFEGISYAGWGTGQSVQEA